MGTSACIHEMSGERNSALYLEASTFTRCSALHLLFFPITQLPIPLICLPFCFLHLLLLYDIAEMEGKECTSCFLSAFPILWHHHQAVHFHVQGLIHTKN